MQQFIVWISYNLLIYSLPMNFFFSYRNFHTVAMNFLVYVSWHTCARLFLGYIAKSEIAYHEYADI